MGTCALCPVGLFAWWNTDGSPTWTRQLAATYNGPNALSSYSSPAVTRSGNATEAAVVVPQ